MKNGIGASGMLRPMKLRNIVLGALAALALAGTAGWFRLDKETRGFLATMPTDRPSSRANPMRTLAALSGKTSKNSPSSTTLWRTSFMS